MGATLPATGQIVQVRSRQYLVEEVVPPPTPDSQSLVRLSCLDDDAQGNPLEVLWERELDARILDSGNWKALAERGFDPPQLFSAYLNTLRWNCVTATNPKLFQAPYRAGIDILPYQLEPLRKALLLPRVNLFIADDVGLGKTIEAGLIVRELLMRQKVRSIVVACPPSVLLQWRDELENRFGLTFVVFDRSYVAEKRRELGYAVNPWRTHSRFIISHALLRDEAYEAPLREALGDFAPGSLLILDEAHNAAPASGAKYAIDSQFTRVVREISRRFEHRLFLSATPHNGHSNSFSALLEILDPQRFCRGVRVEKPSQLAPVMVRRLKSDLRKICVGFPKRDPNQIDISDLPADAPELRLAALLADYRIAREARFREASRSAQAAAALVLTTLQKRLLSSIEAFATTLDQHRRGLEKKVEATEAEVAQLSLPGAPGPDDDRGELPEEEVAAEEAAGMETASRAGAKNLGAQELKLLDEMTTIANTSRGLADARVVRLLAWIDKNLRPQGRWNSRRVLIFTEYADTKRYLEQQLRASVEPARIATFHGGMGDDAREEIKRAFNADPDRHPLRILIATDAAREGVNLQNYCADLFHFDVPWNPSRMEQRNGRIDRKLQRAEVVTCHYFVYTQRPEDRVLRALVRKSQTIEEQLGSMSAVLERRMSYLLSQGIPRQSAAGLEKSIENEDLFGKQTIAEELGATARERDLAQELKDLDKLLGQAREHLGLDEDAFRDTLSCSLKLMGAPPLKKAGKDRWEFPDLEKLTDPSWRDTLDTLRPPCKRDQTPWQWRKETTFRPLVFKDPQSLNGDVVHLHLEQRVVQRLLARLRSQGFVHDDLSRACVGHSRDSVPRVLLLGRLSLYGEHASRLHDEVIAVAARWMDPKQRKGPLRPLGDEAEIRTLELLRESLSGKDEVPKDTRDILHRSIARDIEDLLPHLQARGEDLAKLAVKKLSERGSREAKEMLEILKDQKKRIEKRSSESHQLELAFSEDEKRQLYADRKHWTRRLDDLKKELDAEPARIQQSYEVRARRIEPVGIVYLWPV